MNKHIVTQRVDQALQNHEPTFEKFFLARFFDLQFSYGEDTCTVKMPVEEFMYNPQGSLHGGVIAFILDVSMGHLCKKVLGTAVTLEMKTQYLRAVTSGEIQCTASFLKKGRKIVYMEARLYNEEQTLIATGTSTWHLV